MPETFNDLLRVSWEYPRNRAEIASDHTAGALVPQRG
ncbi:hypothetical protein ACVLB3_002691 [Pseudarthrobacter sp. PvP022]